MLPNILKETVRGIQPILIEDEMLQHEIKDGGGKNHS